jgi:hypothetical protein
MFSPSNFFCQAQKNAVIDRIENNQSERTFSSFDVIPQRHFRLSLTVDTANARLKSRTRFTERFLQLRLRHAELKLQFGCDWSSRVLVGADEMERYVRLVTHNPTVVRSAGM